MKQSIFILTLIASISLSSCHKQDNVTEPLVLEGKFKVDSIGTTVAVKTDTISKKLRTFIAFSIVYHFENYLGILDGISISMANSYGVITTISRTGPQNINELYRYKEVYTFPDSLNNQDSVKILRGLNGAFFEKGLDNDFNFLNTYSWKDSLFIHIER
jgi:hypothetical protein